MKRMNPGQADGFSLIEVGVALAVATFCLVPIVGLLPVGLTNNQSIVRETMATSLADAVIDDLRPRHPRPRLRPTMVCLFRPPAPP